MCNVFNPYAAQAKWLGPELLRLEGVSKSQTVKQEERKREGERNGEMGKRMGQFLPSIPTPSPPTQAFLPSLHLLFQIWHFGLRQTGWLTHSPRLVSWEGRGANLRDLSSPSPQPPPSHPLGLGFALWLKLYTPGRRGGVRRGFHNYLHQFFFLKKQSHNQTKPY